MQKKQEKHEEKLRKEKNILNGCLHSSIHLDSALEEAGSEFLEEERKEQGEQSQEVEGAGQRRDERDGSGGSARALTPLSKRVGAAQ